MDKCLLGMHCVLGVVQPHLGLGVQEIPLREAKPAVCQFSREACISLLQLMGVLMWSKLSGSEKLPQGPLFPGL